MNVNASPRTPFSPAGFRLLLAGLCGLILGAFIGYALRDGAPSRPAMHETENPLKRPAPRDDSSGIAPLRVASAPGEESGGRAAAVVDFVAAARGAMNEVDEWDQMRRLHALIDQLGPADIEAAVAQVRLLPPGDHWMVARMLGERWAYFDPAAALAYAKKLGTGDVGRAITDGAYKKWVALAPDAVRVWLETLPNGAERTGFVRTLAETIAKHDPATALQLLAEVPASQNDNNAYWQVFKIWTEQNPQAAATAASELPRGELREGVLTGIAGTWAATDPMAAIAWAGQIGETRSRRKVLESIVNTWAENDPAAALAWARGIGDASLRQFLTVRALSEWLNNNPAAARLQVLALPAGAERNAAVVSVVQAVGRTDLAAALQLINELPAGGKRIEAIRSLVFNSPQALSDPQLAERLTAMLPAESRSDLTTNIVRHMAQTDVSAALAWAAALPEGQSRKRAFAAAAEVLFGSDPAAALGLILQNNPPTDDDRTLILTFSSWAEAAPSEALAWAFALPAGKTRDALTADGISHLAATDPRQAAELLKTKLPAESQAVAATNLARHWADKEPEAAAAWAGQLPEGEIRSNALKEVAQQWADSNPTAAARWIDRFPVGPVRDAMVRSMTYQVLDADPQGAFAWAATISDTESRDLEVSNLARRWLREDPAAARKWIAGSGLLTAEQKAELLKRE